MGRCRAITRDQKIYMITRDPYVLVRCDEPGCRVSVAVREDAVARGEPQGWRVLPRSDGDKGTGSKCYCPNHARGR